MAPTGKEAREIYLAGYAAFDRGDFSTAVSLATQCLDLALPTSYWHSGALGLRCWAANYVGEDGLVEGDARALLDRKGPEKLWFDGLALFNLALVNQRRGRDVEASELFAQAAQGYGKYATSLTEHPEWGFVSRFFGAVARWAGMGKRDGLESLAEELAELPDLKGELESVGRAARLVLRHALGEEVSSEAQGAALEGVSRAFLAVILVPHRTG
jgi:hypothetical protein